MTIRLPDYIKSTTIRRAKCQVVAITAIHDDDAMWIDQLLAEYDRLDWEVAWHFNNLSKESCDRLASYSRTIGFSQAAKNSPPFVDYHHTYPLEIAQTSGAPWVCVHNADETFEPNAPAMLTKLLKYRNLYIVPWYNIWEVRPDGTLMIRIDGPFIGHKSKFYPIGPWECEFRGPMASMYVKGPDRQGPPAVWTGLRLMHWGFSTPELRERHFAQWNGTTRTGKITYSNYWEGIVNSESLAKVILQPFDPNRTHEQFICGSVP